LLCCRKPDCAQCVNLCCCCGHSCATQHQAFINTAREIYKKISDGVFDVSNEVRVPLCVHVWGCQHTQGDGGAADPAPAAVLPLLRSNTATRITTATAPPQPPHPLQSYGIKVGYGAGGPSSQAVKPGEPGEQRKASSCC
jgi:hypothetical protein